MKRSRDMSSVGRCGGWLCVAAGLLGAASGVFLSVVEPQVSDDRFSYPLTPVGFVAIQLWFVLQHLGLLAGQVALRSSEAAGTGRLVAWAHVLGIAGMVALTLTELLEIAAADDSYPSSLTNILDALYGVSSIMIGAGLAGVGVAVRWTRSWTGWRAWVPSFLGVWVFVPMMPAIVAGFLPARLSITGWMLLFAALGWALVDPRAASGGDPAARPSRPRGAVASPSRR